MCCIPLHCFILLFSMYLDININANRKSPLTVYVYTPNPKQYKNCHSHVKHNTAYSPLDI